MWHDFRHLSTPAPTFCKVDAIGSKTMPANEERAGPSSSRRPVAVGEVTDALFGTRSHTMGAQYQLPRKIPLRIEPKTYFGEVTTSCLLCYWQPRQGTCLLHHLRNVSSQIQRAAAACLPLADFQDTSMLAQSARQLCLRL